MCQERGNSRESIILRCVISKTDREPEEGSNFRITTDIVAGKLFIIGRVLFFALLMAQCSLLVKNVVNYDGNNIYWLLALCFLRECLIVAGRGSRVNVAGRG